MSGGGEVRIDYQAVSDGKTALHLTDRSQTYLTELTTEIPANSND